MKQPLTVERRTLHDAPTPHSVVTVRSPAGEERAFKVSERRELAAPTEISLEDRDGTDGPVIRGHAAVFDRESHDLGGFTEVLARGAFKRALDDPARSSETRALFNHDPNIVLGAVRNNTLDLREDPRGLHYYAIPPDTQQARDVRALIRDGYVGQSSFAFTVERDRWEERDDGTILRTILEIGSLYDVSPVTYPAYPQTDAMARDAADETVVPTVADEERDAPTGAEMASSDATTNDPRESQALKHRELLERSGRLLALERAAR
jgi:hypothetical protein